MKENDIANKITKSALHHFGDKLSSVLLYGSSLSARKNPNDLDIIIVLKERESPEDLSFLRLERLKYEIEIDLQIINIPDIHADSFAHDTHGQFVILFLHYAQPIYGENPFLKFFPKYTRSVTSVIQKAQYYYFRAKKLQANDTQPDDQQDYSFHRKKLMLMLADFWLIYSGKVESFNNPEHISKIITILTHKAPFSGEVNFLLNTSPSFSWANIFSLYQKYYFSILDTLRPSSVLKSMYLGDIYTEHYDIGSDKIAIIASGCPSDYDEKEMIHFLHIRKYNVVTFHYTATGKSTGNKFYPPQDDLFVVIKNYKKHFKKILVIGNSYGGYAALALKNNVRIKVDKIIAISPVIDFEKVKNISTLPKYLSSNHPGWYRFKQKELASFIQNTPKLDNTHPLETFIIHGEFDNQINIHDVQTYCEAASSQLTVLNAGHLSLNRLTRENLDTLDEIL